jgi:hypothetical protein
MDSKQINMKKILLSFCIIFCCSWAQAQVPTFKEWFKQKKTQREYLAKQIVLLKTYLGYLKKGYDIASKGLNTIENIKNGDFNLHRDFFGSLKNVNPHISNSAKVADIVAFQVYILQSLKRVNTFCIKSNQFTPDEIYYVTRVYRNMIYLSDANISELLTIIRSNETEMKDDERLKRINKLYDDMLDKHAFVESFGNDVQTVAREREREKRSIQMTSKQYELI